MKSFKQHLIEASLSRLYDHTKNRNIGMISASRGELTTDENNRRTQELKQAIKKAGFGYVKVKGRYIENYNKPNARNVDEKSLLVIGKQGDDNNHLLGHLNKWGEQFGQDSILHKSHNSENAELHGTNKTGWPGKGETHSVGKWHPNKANEFHSVMNGKTFAFEELQFVTEKGFFSREDELFNL